MLHVFVPLLLHLLFEAVIIWLVFFVVKAFVGLAKTVPSIIHTIIHILEVIVWALFALTALMRIVPILIQMS